jgi:hypothetical protein
VEEDILFLLTSDDDVSDDEDGVHLEDDSDYEESPAAEDDLVTRSTSIWNDYKPKLTTDMAMVAYLCSPNPHVIKHTQECSNLNPKVHLVVDRVIERLILTRRDHTPENKENVLADLIENFWKEQDDFVCRKGYFSRGHIWVSAEREDCVSHEWHKRYSLGFTDVFGEVGCLTTSPTMGCGQAEHNWKNSRTTRVGRGPIYPQKKPRSYPLSVLPTVTRSVKHVMLKLKRLE